MMELPTTAYAVGWYEFGARPADRAGTTVLAGHVDTKAEGLGPLAALRGVDEGSEIAMTAVDGKIRRYRVTDVKVIRKARVPLDQIFARDGRRDPGGDHLRRSLLPLHRLPGQRDRHGQADLTGIQCQEEASTRGRTDGRAAGDRHHLGRSGRLGAPDAGGVPRSRQPDERAGAEPVHPGLARLRGGDAEAAGHPRRLGALVHQRDGGHRDGEAAHHPRLLRVPAAAVRRRVPRARSARARRGGERGRQAHLGRGRRRQLGHRPRHLVGAAARLPGGRHPRGAAEHQRRPRLRLPPRARRQARAAAGAGRADHRQRQRRPQPARDEPIPARRGLRLGAAVQRPGTGSHAGRPGQCSLGRPASRLRRRRADPGPLHPAALPGRSGRRRRERCRRPGRRIHLRVALDDRVHA